MEKPEERLEELRATAKERAKSIDNVVDGTRLVLQSAAVKGHALDGRPIMEGLTVYEIRLRLDDLGLCYPEMDVARAVEQLVRDGEVNLVHTENHVASYQWWSPGEEGAA